MTEPNLAKHLVSAHADGMAVGRTLEQNRLAHQHEHEGPCTIRNHDPQDLSWDQQRFDQVVAEFTEGDPYFYCPDTILADPTSHPIHRMIAEINIGVRDRGERWSKCANCGTPYQLTPEWSSESICSDSCATAYAAYISNPGGL